MSKPKLIFFLVAAYFLGCITMHNYWKKTGSYKAVIRKIYVTPKHGPNSPVVYTFYDGDQLFMDVECRSTLLKVKVR